MVRISQPPPRGALEPQHAELPPGNALIRVYNPAKYSVGPLTFRSIGPLSRFDHHRTEPPAVCVRARRPALFRDPDRAITYAAQALSCCLAEVFGDRRTIVLRPWMIAVARPRRTLLLLDLRSSGAMGAGTTAAIAKTPNRAATQAWARWFYDHPHNYGPIDGIFSGGAHNDQACVTLFERCQADLTHDPREQWPLALPHIQLLIEDIARRHNMPILP
jgi:hypothetical protein